MFFCYLLKCRDGTFYTGITTDLARRVREHNASPRGAKYTRGRRPVRLIYAKKYRTRSAACREEARVKSLPRREKLEMINTEKSTRLPQRSPHYHRKPRNGVRPW